MNKLAHVKPCELRETLEQTILSQDPIYIRRIKDYPNYYILRDGTVVGARGKVLKPDTNSTGYLRVSLCKRGQVKRVFIHRLVAEHFLDSPPERGVYVVNHKDGNRQNNYFGNLEWTTRSENVKDGWLRGRSFAHLVFNFGRHKG